MGFIRRKLDGNENNFWKAVSVYCQKPNSINKEVLFSEIICSCQIKTQLGRLDYQRIYNKLYNYLFCDMKNINEVIDIVKNEEQDNLRDNVDVFNELNGSYFMIRKLFPKRCNYFNQDFFELCILDTGMKTVQLFSLFNKNGDNKRTVYGVTRECDPFVIVKYNNIILHYENNYLNVEYDDNISEKGINWINSVFMRKMLKMISFGANNTSNQKLVFSGLVDVINYYKLYEQLKLKYAKNLVENWSEKTDPQKYVFEDIGIATYLLLLWNEGEMPSDNSQKQRFVDLGCGNGLLVYILNCEGHNGIGIDVQKRKIWDMYPSNVILKEEAIIPGPASIFPDADWLIGNHSDELTPWLPVMARRSSPDCQFFVLPCCSYQLNGRVYQRRNSGLSVYHDYIQYVKEISEICEFETLIDRLRIPSTKRICLIGRKKDLTRDEVDCIQKKIDNYIIKESFYKTNSGNSDKWIAEFQVRAAVEPVRNCTRLPKRVIHEIVLNISNYILKENAIIHVNKGNSVKEWNQGGRVPISDLANILTKDQLNYLKNKCKGLQTLIKNHHYIFHVSEGLVRFRNDEEMKSISQGILEKRRTHKWKEKNCWFHSFHPDGCPLEDSLCSYKHG